MASQPPVRQPQESPPSSRLPMTTVDRARWIGVAAAAATFIGALLPWATGPFGISVSGTSGDGTLAIILACRWPSSPG